VFGAVAGERMASWVRKQGRFASPSEISVDDYERPFRTPRGDLEAIRERLYETMWERVGIIRDGAGLTRALGELDAIDAGLERTGIGTASRAFNLSWHDWLNLRNLTAVGRAIAQAALAREDSRGAHYRDDFPQTGALESSAYTSIAADGGVAMKPVAFTRVRPGQTLLKHAA
jgi:fumarate reductase flavoprotein subunit